MRGGAGTSGSPVERIPRKEKRLQIATKADGDCGHCNKTTLDHYRNVGIMFCFVWGRGRMWSRNLVCNHQLKERCRVLSEY